MRPAASASGSAPKLLAIALRCARTATLTHLFCIAAAAIDRSIRLRIVVPSNPVGSCIWVTLRAASVLTTECCDRLEGAILCFYQSFFECPCALGVALSRRPPTGPTRADKKSLKQRAK